MILYHTAFKFGGIVSISFWSMVIVVASGVIGRFIYIQIPRTIEGRELSLGEVIQLRNETQKLYQSEFHLDEKQYNQLLGTIMSNSDSEIKINFLSGMILRYFENRKKIKTVKNILKGKQVSGDGKKGIIGLVKKEISLNNRIERLQFMQRLFRYWHIAHLPFAIIMLIIMVIHVVVTILFGSRWIF